MTEYLVTVERLMINDKVYRTDKLRIQAHCPEEAQSIVHNHFELHFEPKFRIAKVEEYERLQTTSG